MIVVQFEAFNLDQSVNLWNRLIDSESLVISSKSND